MSRRSGRACVLGGALLLGALLPLACASNSAARVGTSEQLTAATGEPILVLAASDLQFAMPEIMAGYEAQGNPRPTVTFGSTGNFTAQIENGAPADLFFAADQSFLEALERKGLVLEGSRRLYGTGRIVVTPATSASVVINTIEDLVKPEVRKVAIANPEHAPYGRAAQAALRARGLWDAVEPKLVLGENISQAFQLVQTGNAEAGIVALSVILGVPGTPYTLVDATLHPPLAQEATVLKASKRREAAAAFLAYVSGPSGRAVMKRYGFVLPGEQE